MTRWFARRVVALVSVCGLVAGGAGPALAAQTAPTAAGVPVPTGTLVISGALQDGSTVAAGGVTWTPSPCRQGVCSLVLTVSYQWKACLGTSCGATAISWDQPLLPDLLVGPGDVGKKLEVIETATDVRTDGSTQAARVSATSSAAVAPWTAGHAPRVDFIHGLPPSSTASTQEQFALSPPHANGADGVVAVSCSLDGAAYTSSCGSTHSFLTPMLPAGSHTLAVRAANQAGTTTTSYSWAVTSLPSPVACATCFHPPHLDATGAPMTWDWQLSNAGSQLVFRNVDMLDIDGFNNSASVVSGIHARAGRTLAHELAICYVSLGSWEDFRPDAGSWPAAAIGLPLAGYPDEKWVDVRQLPSLLPVISSRLHDQCAGKGFDGVEIDNIDGWDGNRTGLPLTQSDTEAWLAAIANMAHQDGLFVIWKNDPLSVSFGVKYFDGALSEQCYSFKECTPSQESGFHGCNLSTNPCGVQVFAAAGKWVGEVEYPPSAGNPGVCAPSQSCSGSRNFTTFCKTVWPLPPNGFGLAAWRADLSLDGKVFDTCWPA